MKIRTAVILVVILAAAAGTGHRFLWPVIRAAGAGAAVAEAAEADAATAGTGAAAQSRTARDGRIRLDGERTGTSSSGETGPLRARGQDRQPD